MPKNTMDKYKKINIVLLIFLGLLISVPSTLAGVSGGVEGPASGVGDSDPDDFNIFDPDLNTPVGSVPDIDPVDLETDDDSNAEAGPDPIVILVIPNRPPVLNPIGNKAVSEAQLLQFSISGTDPDNDQLTFSATNLPSGASFSGQTFSWTPNYLQAGTFYVTFIVSDGEYTDYETITITVNNVNRNPVITSTPITVATEDITYYYDVNANDPDSDDVLIFLLNGPAGMLINTVTGLISWTPNDAQAVVNTHTVTARVEDGKGGYATQTFTISVTRVNDNPTVSAIQDQNINEDAGFLSRLIDLFSFFFDEEDSSSNLAYSITSETNTGIIDCSLDSNRYIDCQTQQDQNGYSDISVRGQDTGGLSIDDTFRINVAPVNDAPVATILQPGSSLRENDEFTFYAKATDVDGDSLTFTLNFGDGTTINGNVINNAVTYVHKYEKPGSFTITLTISDGETTTVATRSLFAKRDFNDVKNIVFIDSIGFRQEFVSPGDDLDVYLNFENNNNIDLRDARSTAIIRELGIRSASSKTYLNSGESASKFLTLEIPNDAQKGRYWVEVVIDIDGSRRIKYRPIDII